MAVDWLAIRNDYINGGGSYRKLAEKYGVNKDTIAVKAKAENWKGQRDIQTDSIQTKTIQQTADKISEALSDGLAEEAKIKANIRLKLMQMAANWVCDQCGKVNDPADYRRMVQSCLDMGVFDGTSELPGYNREDDPLSKALKEIAEEMNDADQ